VEALVELLDEDEVELEPHAARPSASSTTPASAPILFLITASPLAGLLDDGIRGFRPAAGLVLRGKSL
jgi:hypothetical protein